MNQHVKSNYLTFCSCKLDVEKLEAMTEFLYHVKKSNERLILSSEGRLIQIKFTGNVHLNTRVSGTTYTSEIYQLSKVSAPFLIN